MKKVFLTCDPTYPLFHPSENIIPYLAQILGEAYEITYVNEHFESLEASDYAAFDLVVFYNDHWVDKSPTVWQQIQALLVYAASGGALMVLHTVDIGTDTEMAQMIGAAPVKALTPYPVEACSYVPLDHPAAAGVQPFTFPDEPQEVFYSNLAGLEPLLGRKTPCGTVLSGWTRTYGLGRIACLLPGHGEDAFKNEQYRRLIAQTADWCTQKGAK